MLSKMQNINNSKKGETPETQFVLALERSVDYFWPLYTRESGSNVLDTWTAVKDHLTTRCWYHYWRVFSFPWALKNATDDNI